MSGMVSYNNLTVAPVANLGVQTLVGDGVLHSSATFSRLTGNASYFDATPTMQFAAANVPRWDHDPLTGAALGLLIEQQSTNVNPYSSALNGHQAYAPNCTVTDNVATAPEGTLTASIVVPTSGSTSVQRGYGPNTSTFNSDGVTKWCASAYLGKGMLNGCLVKLDNNSVVGATLNLVSGTVTGASGAAVASVTSAVSYWRVSVNGVPHSGDGRYSFIDLTPATNRDGTLGETIWGVQIEIGAQTTSYIPTTGSVITRSEDVLTYPAPAAQGTILLDHDAAAAASLINTNSTDILTSQGAGKIAIAWDASGTAICYNGGAVTTGAAITWGSDYRLLMNANAHIKPNGALKYPRKLSDAELQAATA